MALQHVAQRLLNLCDIIPGRIRSIVEADFTVKPARGKWSKKEILGHLVDSAGNNHQRITATSPLSSPLSRKMTCSDAVSMAMVPCCRYSF